MRNGRAILRPCGPDVGWLYLAVVLDLFSRRVIGWAMAATQDETLIETARLLALVGRRPTAELLFHSDRGSQYTSDAYRAMLAQANISVSMSRTGNCYDNAVTESFFGTLKGECVERSCFQTRREARQTIFEYVECFYVRSVQPKLTITSKGMAGKGMNLDNS
jgi:transposase InsO family protein